MNADAYIHRLDEIEGWFYKHDAVMFKVILQGQQQRGDLYEVGVYRGKSLALMALLARPHDLVFGFDLYEPPASRVLTETLLSRASVKATLVATNSQTGPLPPTSVPVRFLHIDAAHDYDSVRTDLSRWSTLVADDGVIAADDVFDQTFPGVAAAFHDWLRDTPEWVIFANGLNKSYLCRRDHLQHYMNMILDSMIGPHCAVSSIRGSYMLVTGSPRPEPVKDLKALIAQPWIRRINT
jgi:hypothetical protein